LKIEKSELTISTSVFIGEELFGGTGANSWGPYTAHICRGTF